MSIAREDEFVVSPEMAEVAERSGVHLKAGERVRFTVVPSEPERQEAAWPPAWVASMTKAEPDLATNYRQVMRDEIASR